MQLRTILALMAAFAVAAPVQAQPADAVILDMANAFRQGNKARLAQLLPQARDHALEPWAAYWELRVRLDTASPDEIRAFLNRFAGTYQEDRLRNDWLLLLGSQRRWDLFDAEYPRFRMQDDREVRCYALLSQHLREGRNAPVTLPDDVRRNWFAQREDADGCNQAANRLIAEGSGSRRMTQADAWRKARIAIDANRPRTAETAVAMVAPEAAAQVAELNNAPSRFLTSKVLAASRQRREVIGLALIKLASTDVEAAAYQLDNKWGPQMQAEERDWIWGVIGKASAQKLGGNAHEYFTRVSRDANLNDDLLQWKVRAALRASRAPAWQSIITAVNAMSEEARQDPAWTYWRARALMGASGSDGQRAEGQKILETMASTKGFYEMLALEEVGRKVAAPIRPSPLTDAEKEAARLNAGLNRALYAITIGLRADGVREWNYTTNLHKPGGMTDRELLAAAQFACDREVWDRCINTSDRTKVEFDADQRFPMPFRESVVNRSRAIGLDPAYVYGLIRQESRFIMDARSHVGASGLMQVMPATATWTARKIGLAGFRVDQLNDRETNIAIGTGYLKLVLDDFAGSMPLAAAAYNAGPSRPRAWRNGPTMEAAAWAENVPFAETRDYVKKVLANTTMYAAILTGQPQSIKARLGTVGPREAAQAEPARDIP